MRLGFSLCLGLDFGFVFGFVFLVCVCGWV